MSTPPFLKVVVCFLIVRELERQILVFSIIPFKSVLMQALKQGIF